MYLAGTTGGPPTELPGGAGHNMPAFSPDGRLLAVAGKDRLVFVWDVNDGRRVQTLEGHTGDIYSMAFSPDGKSLAAAGADKTILVWNVTQGTRFETYAIRGEAGSNAICVNGAAAHLADPGDRIIIATYIDVPQEEVDRHVPTVVFVDDQNRPVFKGNEIPGPRRRNGDS